MAKNRRIQLPHDNGIYSFDDEIGDVSPGAWI